MSPAEQMRAAARLWSWLVLSGVKSKPFRHATVAVGSFTPAVVGWLAAQVFAYHHPWFAVPAVALAALCVSAFALISRWSR